jgi:hypothetical protein
MTASCGTTMLIDTNLKTDATIMPVKRTALFLGKEIVSFGTYYTGKVDRTPTLSGILNTEMDVKTLKEEIRFEMKDGSTNKSNVYCIGKLGKEDLSLAGKQEDEEEDVEDIANKQNNTFKGTIDYQNNESKWHFLIINSYSLGGDTSLGYLSNGSLRINIEQVNVYMSGHMTEGERLGYEYILNNEVIGAIDFTGRGRVIMKNDMPGDIKFALANISAALFLKSDLRDSY